MAVQRWTDEMLDKLADAIAANKDAIAANKDAIAANKEGIAANEEAMTKNLEIVRKNSESIEKLTEQSKELNIRFNAYQQASQWVVNLAFGLLATATITTIVSAVVNK